MFLKMYVLVWAKLFVLFSSGQKLTFIEKQVLKHLTEQIRLLSERIVSDLEKAAEELKHEPQDLYSLSTYALMVRRNQTLKHIQWYKSLYCSEYIDTFR